MLAAETSADTAHGPVHTHRAAVVVQQHIVGLHVQVHHACSVHVPVGVSCGGMSAPYGFIWIVRAVPKPAMRYPASRREAERCMQEDSGEGG